MEEDCDLSIELVAKSVLSLDHFYGKSFEYKFGSCIFRLLGSALIFKNIKRVLCIYIDQCDKYLLSLSCYLLSNYLK